MRWTLLLIFVCVGFLRCGQNALAPLAEIPEPYGLEEVDQAVRDQYRVLRQALDDAYATAEPTAVARASGKLGMWHQTYRYPESALRYYQQAESFDSLDPRWPYYMGQVYKVAGPLEQGVKAFERAYSLRPDDIPTRVWLADVLVESGETERARILLEAVLSERPDQPKALLELGSIYLSRKDFNAALPVLEKAYRLQPEVNRIRYALGRVYKGLNRDSEARELLTGDTVGLENETPIALNDPLMAALAELRLSGRNLVARAQAAIAAGRTDEAVELFFKAVETAPDKPGIRLQMADMLLTVGRGPEALTSLREGVNLFPNHAPTWNKFGMFLGRSGDMVSARDAFQRAISINERYEEAHFNLATLMMVQGDIQSALPHLEQAIDLNPGEPRHRVQRTMALWTSQRFAEAIEKARNDREALPGRPVLALLYCRVVAMAPQGIGDSRGALTLAREAFDQTKTLGWLETLAIAEAANGNWQEALSLQTRARGVVPQGRGPWIQGRGAAYANSTLPKQPWFPNELSLVNRPVP